MRGGSRAQVIAVLVLIILVILLALVVSTARAHFTGGRPAHFTRGLPARITGGLPARKTRKEGVAVVVDTLNVTHALRDGKKPARSRSSRPLTLCEIIEAIDRTAPALKEDHERVIYVTKSRDNPTPEELARQQSLYAAAARRNGAYVYVIEEYPRDTQPRGKRAKQAPHAARGRDDFLIGVLAYEWRARVLSKDKFRDFEDVRTSVEPFHVYVYSPYDDAEAPPERLYINPQAEKYRGLRKPRSYWAELQERLLDSAQKRPL